MEINALIRLFEQHKNVDNSLKQEKYLKNQFKFLGISKPLRAELEKPFLKDCWNLNGNELIKVAAQLHNLEQREYMYTAQVLLSKYAKKLSFDDINEIMKLTLINSWWENTDGYNIVIKKWLTLNPNYTMRFINKYYKRKNFWLRRMAIIAQLGFKDQTNKKALTKALVFNLNDNEFFVAKAVGWALRDFSKTDALYVKQFLIKYENDMQKLSVREANKYL